MVEQARTLAMGQNETAPGTRPAITAPFGTALVALGRARDDIVGLTADLGKYTDILPFRDAFPRRFFNMGMAEQNLIAAAAGLAPYGVRTLRNDLRGLCQPPRLRFRGDRLRTQPPKREDRGRPSLASQRATGARIRRSRMWR